MRKAVIFLVILIIASTGGVMSIQSSEPVQIGSFTQFLPKKAVVATEAKPDSIAFVGDVFLGRRVELYLDTYGSDYVYSGLPDMGTSTFLVGNFEAPIPKEHVHTPDMTFSFSVDQAHVAALFEYGFTHMGISNNHTYDKGEDGFVNTQKVLNETGLVFFGNPALLGTSSVSYVELEGYTVALVGIYALQEHPQKSVLRSLFETVALQSDIQIAYVHWGNEYEATHSPALEKLAHTLVEAGVDAVIGHHQHVVQDIELYQGVPIFYSLGNFIFDQYFSEEVQEGLWVEFVPYEDTLRFSLQGVTSIGSRSVPRFMSAYENDIFLKSIAKKSAPYLTEMIQDGVITVAK